MRTSKVTDYERFKLAVADALARWQVVEFNLQDLFIDLIESPDRRWAAAAFHAVIAFKGRLDMVHEILLYRLTSKGSLKKWKGLKNKLFDCSLLRNKLVHWTFIATYTKKSQDAYVYLAVPFGDTRKGQTGKQLTEADIDTMNSTFAILQHEVTHFRKRVATELASPNKS